MEGVLPNSSAGSSGSDPIREVVIGLAIVVLFYVGIGMCEYFYKSFNSVWRKRVELFPNTYTAGSKMYTAMQNPSNPKSLTVYLSENERSGIEFSYSMFINLNSSTFATGNAKLYHILHKGYSQPYPLLGPGIFCWGHKNSIRVYMNSYDSWNNNVDVDNIPVDKWFHLVVSCKGNVMYIYINGSLKQKLNLSNSSSNLVPAYQNYGDVYLFSTRKLTINPTSTASLKQVDPLVFDGTAMGLASSVFYYSYALSYSEINSLMNSGPSPVLESSNEQAMSAYLSDTWWTTNATRV